MFPQTPGSASLSNGDGTQSRIDFQVEETTEPTHENHFNLHSPWETRYVPIDAVAQGRFEAEMDDLVVFGEIPAAIEGTWYRVHADNVQLPPVDVPFVEGDGLISAYRFSDGRVSMKMKYVETERYLLERKAKQRLFGRYRNAWDNHPCVRLANDAAANINIVYWAGDLLAMSERSLPYAVHPDTLETRIYDPYGGQIASRAFTAHPKIDPYKDELVAWGTRAKGLQSSDVVTYSLDTKGRASNEFWFSDPNIPGWCHDAWVTDNWIVLASAPFRAKTDEELQVPNADYWEYVPGKPQELVVIPRYPNNPLHGWDRGEFRRYLAEPGLIVHTGGGWEDANGTLTLDCPFATYNNIFPFWNPPDHQPDSLPTGNYIRFKLDPRQPTGTKLPPSTRLSNHGLTDFPVIDDRYLTRKTTIVYLSGITATSEEGVLFSSIIKLNTETGESAVFKGAPGGNFAEAVFIPRSEKAPEGDGYILFASTRANVSKTELLLLDTEDFSRPIAVIQLPFMTRNQVHGNWVPNPNPNSPLPQLGKPIKDVIATTKFGPLANGW